MSDLDKGQPVPAPAYVPPKKQYPLAVAAMVLSVAAWVTQTHILASFPAMVIGLIALVKLRKGGDGYDLTSGRIFAGVGMGLGCLNVMLIVFAVVLGVVFAVLDIASGGL